MSATVLLIARHALQEALRRRVVLVVVLLTVIFGLLYAWGASELFDDVSGFEGNESGLPARELAGATILGLAMFGTLFLGVILAVFLTIGAVRGDAERGLLQPIVVRPHGRLPYLLGRFLAAASVAALYVLLVYAGAVLVTGVAGDWWPDRPGGAAIRLAGAVVVVAALSLLASVVLGVAANGIAILMVYGAGLLAGLLGAIGDVIPSATLSRIADITSWAFPFEALYRDALRLLVDDVDSVEAVVLLGPLGGSFDAGPLLVPYVVAYVAGVLALAARLFARRDL